MEMHEVKFEYVIRAISRDNIFKQSTMLVVEDTKTNHQLTVFVPHQAAIRFKVGGLMHTKEQLFNQNKLRVQ